MTNKETILGAHNYVLFSALSFPLLGESFWQGQHFSRKKPFLFKKSPKVLITPRDPERHDKAEFSGFNYALRSRWSLEI